MPPDWKWLRKSWKVRCQEKKGTAQGGKERSCQCCGKTRRSFGECFSLHMSHNELGVKLKGQMMYYERVLNDGTYALTYFKWYVLKTLSSFYAHVASFSSWILLRDLWEEVACLLWFPAFTLCAAWTHSQMCLENKINPWRASTQRSPVAAACSVKRGDPWPIASSPGNSEILALHIWETQRCLHRCPFCLTALEVY